VLRSAGFPLGSAFFKALTARSSMVAFMADHSFVVVMVNCLGTMVTITASPGMFVLRNDGGALVSALFPSCSALFPSACAFLKR